MTRFQDAFASLRVFLPVIHVRNQQQGVRNALVAFENGADGVFFISHGYLDYEQLSTLAANFKMDYPDRWVGVNYLDLPNSLDAVRAALHAELDGVWVDDAGIRESTPRQTAAAAVYSELVASGQPTLLFGSVAFKYQAPVMDVGSVAALAAPHMDVVVTSGPGTGMAAEPPKLKHMASAGGEVPLGLASGVSAANAHLFLPYVTCYLVASSLIGSEQDEFIPEQVRILADTLHEWRPVA